MEQLSVTLRSSTIQGPNLLRQMDRGFLKIKKVLEFMNVFL